jgi:adenosylcobinamide-phosphate synthase
MSDLVGHHTERHRAFGFAVARLNDILLFIPARLAAVYTVLGSILVPTANPILAVKIMLRDSGKHHSLNLGWTVAAMAGALDLALGGPSKVNAITWQGSWIGDGTAKVTSLDIRRGLYLLVIACLINTAWVAALCVVRLA